MVEAAQEAFDHAMLERVSIAGREIAARNLETAVERLPDFVLRDICPPDLKGYRAVPAGATYGKRSVLEKKQVCGLFQFGHGNSARCQKQSLCFKVLSVLSMVFASNRGCPECERL